MIKTTQLPYQSGFEYYRRIYHCHAPVLLDSTSCDRFDILSAEPTRIIIQNNDVATLFDTVHQTQTNLTEPAHHYIQTKSHPQENYEGLPELPFIGGWLGAVSYDYARHLVTLPSLIKKDNQLPDLWFAYYEWVVVCDHEEKKSYLVYESKFESHNVFKKFMHALDQATEERFSFSLTSNFSSSLSENTYHEKFKKIKEYIRDGHIYQTNFSQRFKARFSGDPIEAYAKLRNKNPAPYAAMMKLSENQWICSCSPERFIKISNDHVNTKPIKGTRPRSSDPKIDLQNKIELQQSIKDQAENLMIVDLLRNDLSMNTIPGSVKVPELFECHSFKNVHHLVSTITATLKPDSEPLKLIFDAFPGGSVTGAPKLRAMEISEEIEPVRRAFFCGSILYYSKHRQLDSNILIRTAVFEEQTTYLWAGGGIVYDSEAAEEYQETFDKVNIIMDILREQKSWQT